MSPTVQPRIELRRLAPADMDDYARLFCDPEIGRLDETAVVRREDLPAIFDKLARLQAGSMDDEYAIVEAPGGPLLGVLSETLEDGLLFLGYHVLPEARGRGLASGALVAYVHSVDPAWRPLLRLAIDPTNQASRKVASRGGFQRIGLRERGALTEELYVLGAWPDGEVGGLLA